MESLVIAFAIGVLIYLNSPKKPRRPKDPWEEMGRAIGKALNTVGKEDQNKSGKNKSEPNELFWVIALSAFIGAIVIFGA